MVRSVMRPFVCGLCEDENTVIKVVLFDNRIDCFDIPRDRAAADRLIDSRVKAQGGTDFHEAAKGMVTAAAQLLRERPTFQVRFLRNFLIL